MSSEERPVQVVIVDDDPFVATSLSTILGAEGDIEVVGCGANGEDACALYEELRPDILLADIQMPVLDGLAAAERILSKHPDARIVLLTTFSDDEYIVRSLRLGTRGYLVKQDVGDIAPALRSVMAGQNVLGSEVVGKMGALMSAEQAPGGRISDARGEALANAPAEADAANGAAPDDGARRALEDGMLTAREQAIVELVAQGLDNREIARTLYLSEGTVRNHISAILQKLGLRNRTQIAVWFYRR